MLEIERKFHPRISLSELKELISEEKSVRIKQIYIQPAPIEIRVRRYVYPDGTKVFEKTTKKGLGLVREEVNQNISFEEYTMFERTYPTFITKTRYFYTVDDKVFEIDFYKNGTVTIEIEFENEEEAKEFNPTNYDFLGNEITGDPNYSNYQMALNKKEYKG